MKFPSSKQIYDMAQSLQAGARVYYHKETGEILEYPVGIEDWYTEEENPFQDVLDKVEANPEDYVEIEPMHSREAYRIMERFAEEMIDDPEIKILALDRLAGPKPFRRFKDLVEYSDYRESWFAFQQKAYEDYVRKILELELADDDDLDDGTE